MTRRCSFLLVLAFFLLLSACTPQFKPLSRPNGVAVLEDGSLYVTDFGNYRIVHLSSDGKLLDSLGSFGPAAGQIYYAWDLALGPQGDLFFGNVVRDNEGVRHDGVLSFDRSGGFLQEFGSTSYTAETEAHAYLPYGLDVDDAGRVYTADYRATTLRIFDPEGKKLLEYAIAETAAEGLEMNPGDVAFDDQRSLLYVTDFTYGAVLQYDLHYDAAGQPLLTFRQRIGEFGDRPGQFGFPQNLAVDDDSGRVYIGDQGNRRVQVFDADGNFINTFRPDVPDWQVMGLALGPNGWVYAADALNHCVWAFDPQGQVRLKVELKP
jgi:DNA-binding beta-propeller fold protein YncE